MSDKRGQPDWTEREAARRERAQRLAAIARGDIAGAARIDEQTRQREEVPVFSECVIGYRQWIIGTRRDLWPVSSQIAPWVPGVNVAKCSNQVPGSRGGLGAVWGTGWITFGQESRPKPPKHHAAPHQHCDCGLYAWRRPSAGLGGISPAEFEYPETQATYPIMGAVAAWGNLQVHADGFRASHACIVALCTLPKMPLAIIDIAAEVARDYRAELVAYDELEQAASRFGTPLPDGYGPQPAPPLWQVAWTSAVSAPGDVPEDFEPIDDCGCDWCEMARARNDDERNGTAAS